VISENFDIPPTSAHILTAAMGRDRIPVSRNNPSPGAAVPINPKKPITISSDSSSSSGHPLDRTGKYKRRKISDEDRPKATSSKHAKASGPRRPQPRVEIRRPTLGELRAAEKANKGKTREVEPEPEPEADMPKYIYLCPRPDVRKPTTPAERETLSRHNDQVRREMVRYWVEEQASEQQRTARDGRPVRLKQPVGAEAWRRDVCDARGWIETAW
jgi:hypothetical protein